MDCSWQMHESPGQQSCWPLARPSQRSRPSPVKCAAERCAPSSAASRSWTSKGVECEIPCKGLWPSRRRSSRHRRRRARRRRRCRGGHLSHGNAGGGACKRVPDADPLSVRIRCPKQCEPQNRVRPLHLSRASRPSDSGRRGPREWSGDRVVGRPHVPGIGSDPQVRGHGLPWWCAVHRHGSLHDPTHSYTDHVHRHGPDQRNGVHLHGACTKCRRAELLRWLGSSLVGERSRDTHRCDTVTEPDTLTEPHAHGFTQSHTSTPHHRHPSLSTAILPGRRIRIASQQSATEGRTTATVAVGSDDLQSEPTATVSSALRSARPARSANFLA